MAIKKPTKPSAKPSKSAAPKKATTSKKTPTQDKKIKLAIDDLTGEQLVVENLATLSNLVGCLSETLDVLVQKVESMAYHIIATEEVLAELVSSNGLDLAHVNARIRAKVANGTNNLGDPTKAIDVAASIASPLPKTRK